MYVWFDALTNYISGVNYRNEDDPLRNKFWCVCWQQQSVGTMFSIFNEIA